MIIWLIKRTWKKSSRAGRTQESIETQTALGQDTELVQKTDTDPLDAVSVCNPVSVSRYHCLHTGKSHSGGWSIVSAIFMLLIQELPKYLTQTTLQESRRIPRSLFWGLFCLLISITLFLRVYKLDEIPWGINNDAAWNGMYALRSLDGEEYTPFTQEAWGKSTLYFYMIALAFKWFGASGTTLISRASSQVL